MASSVSRFAYRNWAWESGVTVTASAEATGYPATNLSSSASWKIWRSSVTVGDQWVKFDLGASRAMTGCLLRYASLHVGGSVRFQANATDTWGSPTIDTVFTVPSTVRSRNLSLFFATQTQRWVRIYFTNTAAVSQAVELGIAFPSDPLTLTYPVRDGVSINIADLTLNLSSIGGQQQADRRAQRITYAVDPNVLDPTTRSALIDVMIAVGTALPFFFILDDSDPNLMNYGRLVNGWAFQNIQTTVDLWSAPFTHQEDL